MLTQSDNTHIFRNLVSITLNRCSNGDTSHIMFIPYIIIEYIYIYMHIYIYIYNTMPMLSTWFSLHNFKSFMLAEAHCLAITNRVWSTRDLEWIMLPIGEIFPGITQILHKAKEQISTCSYSYAKKCWKPQSAAHLYNQVIL
jgi:hypothetical protein